MSSTFTSTTRASTKVIVLTGASGYLGQHCLRELIEYDCDNDIETDADDDINVTEINTTKKDSPSTPRMKRKTIIYALVNQTSSKTELTDAIASYYNNTCDDDLIKKHYQECVTVVTVALDITSPSACDEWFESLQSQQQHTSSNESNPPSTRITLDCCIHTAALSSPVVCEQQPEYAMSINVPTHFLQRLFLNNPNITIIALSTDQVYDGNISGAMIDSTGTNTFDTSTFNNNKNEYYNEFSKCEPCNVYGTTKVALESYLLQQQQLHYPQASVILLRSSIILGPKVPFLPHKTHTTFLHFCHSRMHESTTYYTNEIRSVIAVSDVVRIILHFMKYVTGATTPVQTGGISEVYCMGGPAPVNRYDMAKAVLSHFQVADASNEIAVPVLKESPPTTSSVGSVASPLNISMDSTKLLQFIRNTSFSTTTTVSKTSNNMTLLNLSDIVVQTFSNLQPESIK